MSNVHIKDLQPDKRNARKHNPRNIGMIERSLNEVGAARSIVIDEENNILAGNGTIEAAANAGIHNVQIVDADGETIIAVRRRGLTPEQKQRLALFDNRTTDTSEFDNEVLAVLLNENSGILDGMFDDAEIDALIESLNPLPEPGAGGDEFDTTPDEMQTRVQRGDLWQLGRHRLLCGDSTNADDVARLMQGERVGVIVTDPPYGVHYNRHIPNPKHADLANDQIADPERLLSQIPDADAWYVWSRWDVLQVWIDAISLPVRNVIVWDKQTNGMGDLTTTYAPSWEACIFASRSGHKLRGSRDRDVWEATRPDTDDHLTPKPIELIKRCIEKSSDPGALVFDAYMGSGTTLIAAERTGRRCYGIEIEPKYCDVILRRWEAETGLEAVKVDTMDIDDGQA